MYQQHPNAEDITGVTPTKENFTVLTSALVKTAKSTPSDFPTNSSQWDLTKIYVPTHSAIWNNPKNLGEKCVIIQKDDRFALVYLFYRDKGTQLVEKLYRLQDLKAVA